MAERITERTDGVTSERVVERDPTHTTTVVERDSGRSGGGLNGLIIGVVLLVAVVIAGYFLLNMSRQESVRTDAIAGAAGSVADSVDNAADSVAGAAESVTTAPAQPAE